MAKSSISKPTRICKVDGCEKRHLAKGYCDKHYRQVIRNGRILNRTVKDPNHFTIKGPDCIISLYDEGSQKVAEAVVDSDDLHRVKDFKWGLNGVGYVYSRTNGTYTSLSRWLMQPVPNGLEIDHIDRNPLNNRRINLRYATSSQNKVNRIQKNTNGLRGVCLDKSRNRWMARIQSKRKTFYLGRFDSKIEAARVYNKKALELHGEFAMLNEV